MHRRDFLLATAVAAIATPNIALGTKPQATGMELTLTEISAAFADGRLTSRRLTKIYLDRINALDRSGPKLGAVLEINPQALDIAAQLDRERQTHGARGPLHGVPILNKDNVETADRMMTTAGSLALEGWYAPKDAPLVARLRAAGAVTLGKTNLSEWANLRSTHSSSSVSRSFALTKAVASASAWRALAM